MEGMCALCCESIKGERTEGRSEETTDAEIYANFDDDGADERVKKPQGKVLILRTCAQRQFFFLALLIQ